MRGASDLPEPEGPEGGGDDRRCGFVALLGAPNAGKSTLMNALVGAKVSIVSPKVQTTRTRVRGIVMAGAAQLVFIDTPGIFAPKRRLDRAMVKAAWTGAQDADIIGVMVDAQQGLTGDVQALLTAMAEFKHRGILILNKVDRLKDKSALLNLSDTLFESGLFDAVFMISAKTGQGTQELLTFLIAGMKPGPWMFPPEDISDMPLRLLAAEITREKLYLQLQQELPYAATVETDQWIDQPDGSVRIEQTVFVERDGQKAIVLGKAGTRVKEIGRASREELSHIFERKVHLFLFVKVRENWGDDPNRLSVWGLDHSA